MFAIVFYGLLLVYFFRHRDKFQVQAKIFALYRTKLGLKLMDKIAKSCPRFLRLMGGISVVVGFGGMAFIFYFLIKGTFDLLFVADAAPAVAPILPGIKILPGLPVLSFWHWIIAIFLVAVVHEFCHGIYAKLYDIPVKSSGFAFLGPILAAFVEPDENVMKKKKKYVQLALFSAGPFSNLVMGVLFMLLLNLVFIPANAFVYEQDGVTVNKLLEGYPAAALGIEAPFTIIGVNGKDTRSVSAFVNVTQEVKPGDSITLLTDKGEYAVKTVENPDNKSRPFIGISELEVKTKPKEAVVNKYGSFVPKVFSWTHLLVFWMVVVSVGVGLFNLLPLGPIDGGRMFLTGAELLMKPERAKKVWSIISFFGLLLIFVNIVPYLWKLLLFMVKPLTGA